MAEYKFTAALNAATFPLVTKFQPRSVVIAGTDNLLRNAAGSATSYDRDNNPQNLPQVVYCENVMPTDEAVMSVGFAALQAAVGGSSFDEVFILYNEFDDATFFSPAHGYNYTTPAFGSAWTSTNPLAGIPVAAEVSVAYVNGQTYVCYSMTKLLLWDGAAFTDVSATLTGTAIGDIVAITGAGNYLILVTTDLSIKWSSLINPLDFVPSDTTGAGSQIPSDVKGKEICLTSVSGGFIIHCTQNAVAALSTNNVLSPWIFREIKNAGGISNRKNVSTDNTSGATFIWGTNGFQQVGLREADNLFPPVNDFIAGRVLETFDSATNLLTVTRLDAAFNVKIAYVAGRYIVISYGQQAEGSPLYQYALVYDNGLKRWGKLKHNHVDCFSGYFDPRQSICFLDDNGAVTQAVLDGSAGSDAGVIVLGKYQLNRTNQICSQEVELEVLDGSDNPAVIVATSYNGTTVGQQLVMFPYSNTGNYRCFQKQIEGENLSFIIKGSFQLATVLLRFTKGAKQ